MTGALWMPGIPHRDLTGRPGGAGNHVPGWRPEGIVLHVNDSPIGSFGTSIDWYAAGGGPDSVCPTWQVYPDGTGTQLLPVNVQPWTQRDGNSWGVSVETGGNHAEPLTPAAVATVARIVKFMHDEWAVPLQVTDHPSRPGLGTHEMGGEAWGGHPCPGKVRADQRAAIIAAAQGHQPPSGLLEEIVALDRNSADYKNLVADISAAVWAQNLTFQPGQKTEHTAKASTWLTYANRYALRGITTVLSSTARAFKKETAQ